MGSSSRESGYREEEPEQEGKQRLAVLSCEKDLQKAL